MLIGRDQLVHEIKDLLDEEKYPQVIVGATGSGKTMVLLKLAQHLARTGLIPIPITLRDATHLDFERHARDGYLQGFATRGRDDSERQWRWLRHRIVVIVDDLDKAKWPPGEVLQALYSAADQRLRVVAASEPQGIPEDFDRWRIDLEPLAVDSIVSDLIIRSPPWAGWANQTETEKKELLTRLVESADISATPYYLGLARVLAATGELLGLDVTAGRGSRIALLATYRDALASRRLQPDAGLDPEMRLRVLKDLEAVASLLVLESDGALPFRDMVTALGSGNPQSEAVTLNPETSLEFGERLGILVPRSDGSIGFGHPLTAAYFAACFLARGQQAEIAKAYLKAAPSHSLARSAIVLAGSLLADIAMGNELARHLVEMSQRGQADGSLSPSRRLELLATALAALPSSAPHSEEMHLAIIDAARMTSRSGGLVRDQLRFIEVIGRVRSAAAYRALLEYATTAAEYPVRRAAINALGQGGDAAIEAVIALIDEAISSAESALQDHAAPARNASGAVEAVRAVAWILPTLRTACHDDATRRLLESSQERLGSLAAVLPAYTGLEEATAQGLKLDAWRNPHLPPDPVAFEMLGRGTSARSWWARVLLVQAVARRASDGEARSRAISVLRDLLRDEHPFVRETARLAKRGLTTGRWRRYLWEDVSVLVAGDRTDLAVITTQLIADMVLALNLREQGRIETRVRFAEEALLPACLSSASDRWSIIGSKIPPPACPFSQSDGCLCPYDLRPAEGRGVPRELSREFCRSQRRNARPLPWQSKMKTKALREFWRQMEYSARI